MAAHAASASASASPFFTQYLLRLKSLTTTDAALIESLTRIADEHADSSKEVVKAMEQHLRQLASGDHRLPLLYLIDSLCRNLPRRDFPKRFDPLIRAMIESTTKRASKKVQGRIYRMIDVWTRHKVFRQERLDELDTMMSKYMTDDEKAQALEQQSAAGVKGGDPRKRAAAPAAAGTEKGASVASSAVPAAKRPMINDPRLAQKNAAAVPSAGAIPSYLPPLPAPLPMLPILPLTPPPPPVPSSELAVLEGILDGPEVQSRPDLQPMVQLIRSDLKRPMPPAEMKAVIIAAAQQLMKALTQKPQTQTVFMTQPPRVWNPAAAATTVAAASASVPSMTAKQLQQSELHLSATFSDLDLKTRVAGASDALFAGRACKQCGRRFADAAMAGHLEWHRLMAQRKKLLDDTGLGNSSSSLLMGSHQKWYWEEWEWIQAPDVIFGVQTKAGEKVQKKDGTASSGGAASSQGRGPGAQAVTEKEDGPKYEAQSVVADDAQKKCPMCAESFKSEWDNDTESWMYHHCQQITLASDATNAMHEVDRLQAIPPPDLTVYEPSSAQYTAAVAKEEDRQTDLWRQQQIIEHVKKYNGMILHQACHHGRLYSIMKSRRPQASPTPMQASNFPPPPAAAGAAVQARSPSPPAPEVIPPQQAAVPMEEDDGEEYDDDDDDGVQIVLSNQPVVKQDEPMM